MIGRQLKKLATVAKMVGGSNSTWPISQQITVTDEGFFVTDIESDITITPSIPLIPEHSASLPAVPIKEFGKFATKVSVKDDIELTLIDNKLSVTRGKVSKAWDKTTNPSDLPKTPTSGSALIAKPVAETFVNNLRRLAPFVAKDDYRPALNGYCLHIQNGELVATNGNILGVLPEDNCYPDHVSDNNTTAIFNPTVYRVLNKIKPVGEIKIEQNGKYLRFTCKDTEGWEYKYNTEAVEGPYPPYKKVYPNLAEYRAKFILPLKMMENANKFMIGNINTPAILYLDNDHPRITQVKNGTKTSIDVETEITALTDNKSNTLDGIERIGLNPSLLGDVSKLFDNNPTVFYISNTKAIALTDDTTDTLAILMPMQIPGE